MDNACYASCRVRNAVVRKQTWISNWVHITRFFNNLHHVRLMSKDWKDRKSLGSRLTKGLQTDIQVNKGPKQISRLTKGLSRYPKSAKVTYAWGRWTLDKCILKTISLFPPRMLPSRISNPPTEVSSSSYLWSNIYSVQSGVWWFITRLFQHISYLQFCMFLRTQSHLRLNNNQAFNLVFWIVIIVPKWYFLPYISVINTL